MGNLWPLAALRIPGVGRALLWRAGSLPPGKRAAEHAPVAVFGAPRRASWLRRVCAHFFFPAGFFAAVHEFQNGETMYTTQIGLVMLIGLGCQEFQF